MSTSEDDTIAIVARTIRVTRLTPIERKALIADAHFELVGHIDGRYLKVRVSLTEGEQRDEQRGEKFEPRAVRFARASMARQIVKIMREGWPAPEAVQP